MIVRRGVLTDHYVEDDRSVVMVDESVLGLSPIATAILEAVPEGVDVGLPAVTQHVVATFGSPAGTETAEALTEQQVWDLVAHHVLVLVEDERPRDGTSSLLDHRSDSDALEPDGAAAVNALRDALRHLRSEDDGRWSAPDSLSPRGLVSAARQHHVIPYLAANLDRLDIPGQARSELEAAAGRQRAGAAVLAADLSRALEALREAGVRALAFKGVALAALAYGDFRMRGTGDLDLLVAPEDLNRAHRALTQSGWRPAPAYPVPGSSWAWRHFGRTGNELTFVGTHSDIDLHWHLVPTRGTFPDFDTLWSRRALPMVADHSTPTLSPYDALAHSAGHAAKDRWRWLRSLLDIHQLASQPETWSSVDRPLRRDQMLSLGLAVRMFGPPDSSAADIARECVGLTDRVWDSVAREQVDTGEFHRAFRRVGPAFVHNVRGLVRTGAPIRETGRLISRSVFPAWHTSQEPSPHALVAAPRVLLRRTHEVVQRLARN